MLLPVAILSQESCLEGGGGKLCYTISLLFRVNEVVFIFIRPVIVCELSVSIPLPISRHLML